MKTKKNTTTAMQLPGALALAAAGAATQANAATVQISFANNVLSLSTGYTNFVPDLTGDGSADIMGIVGYNGTNVRLNDGVPSNGFEGIASTQSGSVLIARVGWVKQSARFLVPLNFSDTRINNASVTSGFMDVSGSASLRGRDAQLKIHRLIFDNSSTTAPAGVSTSTTGLSEWGASSAVPEASTSLGLLALCAGGLLTRRRQKRAA